MQTPEAAALTQAVLDAGATLTTLRGPSDGPTLTLLGGIHGDEDEGVLAVYLVLRRLAGAPLAGTVRAVAPAHPTAWAAHLRTGPLDGLNLARCFPGDAAGSPTERLAAGITAQAISGCDLLIDLHSAGVRYEMPLFCGFTRGSAADERSRRAAVAFGAPLVWEHPYAAPGRSLTVAAERDIPAVYAECGGGGGVRGDELDAYVRGVLAVMVDLGMLPEPCHPVAGTAGARPRFVYGSGDLDDGAQSQHDGLFVSDSRAGAVVRAGERVGRLYDYAGQWLHDVEAVRDGMVMFLRRQARVQAGDVLYVLADLDEERA